MKLIIAIVILLFLPFKSSSPNFCVCSKLDNKNVAEMKKNSDVIVIGKFTQRIPLDRYDQESNLNGYFKIDSIIKGPNDLENLVINQFSTGNCHELFELDKEYLVLGIHIKGFKDLTAQNKSDKSDGEHLPPPPSNEIHNSIMDCFSSDKRTLKKWNKIADRNYVIHTNQCSTYKLSGKFAKMFLE